MPDIRHVWKPRQGEEILMRCPLIAKMILPLAENVTRHG